MKEFACGLPWAVRHSDTQHVAHGVVASSRRGASAPIETSVRSSAPLLGAKYTFFLYIPPRPHTRPLFFFHLPISFLSFPPVPFFTVRLLPVQRSIGRRVRVRVARSVSHSIDTRQPQRSNGEAPRVPAGPDRAPMGLEGQASTPRAATPQRAARNSHRMPATAPGEKMALLVEERTPLVYSVHCALVGAL